MKRKFYRKSFRLLQDWANWFWVRWMNTYPAKEHTYADDQEPS